MVNRERLGHLFKDLVQVDSISKREGKLASILAEKLRSLGGNCIIDDAGEAAGGDTGNVIARYSGTVEEVSPLLLCAHMDTVQPGEGVQVIFSDGVFSSAGETILGADDKSSLAVILEVLQVLGEEKIAHGPLEVVFTICEEVGLLGAKHLDYALIQAPYGFCLDSGDVDGIVRQAPALNELTLTVLGRSAHAGAEPEKGVNAIHVASKAIARLSLGRIDEETTANIGMIEGGRATNIVPEEVKVTCEVRSHDEEKLNRETKRIVQCFEEVVATYKEAFPAHDGRPKVISNVKRDFSNLQIPEGHPVIQIAEQAAGRLGRALIHKASGGGSDGNILFEHGIVTGILGTGMKDVHSVRESIALDDMVRSAQLLLEIIRVHAEV